MHIYIYLYIQKIYIYICIYKYTYKYVHTYVCVCIVNLCLETWGKPCPRMRALLLSFVLTSRSLAPLPTLL